MCGSDVSILDIDGSLTFYHTLEGSKIRPIMLQITKYLNVEQNGESQFHMIGPNITIFKEIPRDQVYKVPYLFN